MLARRFAVTPDTVYSWEYNKFEPSAHHLPRIMEFLGYKPEVILRTHCGEQILAYRKAHGLTQQKFADLLGIHKGTLSQWEKNRKRPSKQLLRKLSTFITSLSLKPVTKSE
ncbi:MAG: helix-turn-helix transcriptional regulator [Ignavibacteriae bacterium]|nr:helix-turn-helix transcriptional regulator [Ignavibacteria bacterium]MBI3365259.1 helix-turn-helix transcriptional regulator [Ignavibacteriota bacterium]